jgi:hypothetical protein
MQLTLKKIKLLVKEELEDLQEDYYSKFLGNLGNKQSIKQLRFILLSLPMGLQIARKFNDELSKVFASFTEEAEIQGWEPTDEMEMIHEMLQVLFDEFYNIDEYRTKDFIYNKLVSSGMAL